MKKYFFIAGALILFFSSCKKELSENFNQYTGDPRNDTVWATIPSSSSPVFNLASQLFPDLVIDSFNCTNTDTIDLKEDAEMIFPGGGCVTGTGAPVDGKVRLEIFRLKKKGDFIKFFKPTTANGYLLESAGGFFIRISKEGQELNLKPGKTITIHFRDTEEAKPNMQVFYARETLPFITKGWDTAHTWLRDADTSWIKTWQQPNTGGSVNSGYDLNAHMLRWVGAFRYIDSTQPRTKIFAYLPPNFTNKNTVVYAVFANQKIVVGLPDDFRSRTFAAGNIPLRSKIKIVTLSRLGTDLYLGEKEVNDVGSITTYKVEPQKKSLSDILNYLNNL